MKRLKTLCIALLALTACTSDELPEAPNANENNNETFITLDKAIKTAEYYVSTIDDDKTRSDKRVFSNFEIILADDSETRSNKPLYYIINFDDNEGFAVVSADSRLDQVYAFSDEGNIFLSDTTLNKGLGMFFQSLPKSANGPARVITDPLPNPTKIEKIVPPLLTKSVQKWGQKDPYNIYCPVLTDSEGNSGNAVVGCPALAVGIAMTYFEKPKSYNGYSFNWSAMKNGSDNNGAARLLQQVGLKQNMNIQYGLSASGVNLLLFDNSITNTLKNMGYSTPAVRALNEDSLQYALKYFGPLIVNGVSSRSLSIFDKNGLGHVWNIDGFIKATTEQLDPVSNKTNKTYSYYYHCVWGWYGKSNGYFKCKQFSEKSLGIDGTPVYTEDGEQYEITHNWNTYVRIYFNY